MTEKDLDIAIEKCERILEMDTRTLKNPESENGWLFEKVYDLLKFLRQFQFETVGMDDTISRTAILDAVDGVDWYHQNQHGEMVHGANSDKHQAWYKAEDIYTAIESVQSAQPDHIGEVTEMVGDVVSRQGVLRLLNAVPSEEFATKAMLISGVNALPSAQPEFDKQELIRTITTGIIATNTEDVYSCGMRNGMRWCKSLLEEEAPKFEKYTQPEQRWIPCDMGEPDEDMECWVTVKTTDALYRGNFTKRYGERRDKGFITSGGFMWWNTALAWQPLPTPYREGGQDG